MSTAADTLRVIRTRDLSLNLRRIVFGGVVLDRFAEGCDGAPLELVFGTGDGATTRTFSVAHHDTGAHELTLDFVLHDAGGPATEWARRAVPGTTVGLVAPAATSAPQKPGDWYLLAGDASALGLFNAVLHHLPRTARGAALIETGRTKERIVLERPGGIAVRWLVRNSADRPGESRMLIEEIRGMDWEDDKTPSVLLAGEDAQVRAVRDYLIAERNVPVSRIRIEPHWKDLCADEEYRDTRLAAMAEYAG